LGLFWRKAERFFRCIGALLLALLVEKRRSLAEGTSHEKGNIPHRKVAGSRFFSFCSSQQASFANAEWTLFPQKLFMTKFCWLTLRFFWREK